MIKTAFEQGQSDALTTLGLVKEALSKDFILRAIKGRAQRDLGTRNSGGAWNRWADTLHEGHPGVLRKRNFDNAKNRLMLDLKIKSLDSAPRAWSKTTDKSKIMHVDRDAATNQIFKDLSKDMGYDDYNQYASLEKKLNAEGNFLHSKKPVFEFNMPEGVDWPEISDEVINIGRPKVKTSPATLNTPTAPDGINPWPIVAAGTLGIGAAGLGAAAIANKDREGIVDEAEEIR